ncbi:MAG: arylsulfatase [Bryobacteraceae bacterium]|nr:arylsulfatase [Bryobacteraceae bacterium]
MNVTRRSFLRVAAGSAARAAAGTQPNVLLVITDDQGYGDLGCHGNPVLRTPALDRLSARSVRFTNFHVSPTCAPTRASLLTGRYSNATGVWHTIMGRSLLRPGEVTLADCFRGAGYRTGIFGKWHLGDNYPCRPQDRGFEESVVHGGGGVWQTPDWFGNDYFDDVYRRNGRPERFRGHCTEVWFREAQRFMDRAAAERQPFFCYLASNAPHSPMWSPERLEKRYRGVAELKEPGFYGMIEHLDAQFGRLRWPGNTIVLFMTDNGTAAGARVHNAGMRGAKGSAYEGGHRVPLFVSWPEGGLGAARDVSSLTAHIDVLPTLLELCGVQRPAGPELHGVSLVPLLRGRAEGPERTVVVDSQRCEEPVQGRQFAAMRGRWRLVNPSPEGDPARLELYDLDSDYGQQRNVAGRYPEMVRRLTEDYREWWRRCDPDPRPVRVIVGSESENPVRLTAHDWHGNGAERIWNQQQVREAPAVNGMWRLEAARAGRYRIELRRWPVESGLALRAAAGAGGRERTAGVAVEVVKAHLSAGNVGRWVDVKERDAAAVFEMEWAAGAVDLQGTLVDASGAERGAYFAVVRRL